MDRPGPGSRAGIVITVMIATLALIILTSCGTSGKPEAPTADDRTDTTTTAEQPVQEVPQGEEPGPANAGEGELDFNQAMLHPNPVTSTPRSHRLADMQRIFQGVLDRWDVEYVPDNAYARGVDENGFGTTIRAMVDPLGNYEHTVEVTREPTDGGRADDTTFMVLFGNVLDYTDGIIGPTYGELAKQLLATRADAYSADMNAYTFPRLVEDLGFNVLITGLYTELPSPTEDLAVMIPVEGSDPDQYKSMSALVDHGMDHLGERIESYPNVSYGIGSIYTPIPGQGDPILPEYSYTTTMTLTSPSADDRPPMYDEGGLYVLEMQMIHPTTDDFRVETGVEVLRTMIAAAPQQVRDAEEGIIATYEEFMAVRPADPAVDGPIRYSDLGFWFTPSIDSAVFATLTIYVDENGEIIEYAAG